MNPDLSFKKHPIELLFTKIIPQLPKDAVMHFSVYNYSPQSVFESRETIEILVEDLDLDFINKLFNNLTHGQELAINSNIIFPDKTVKHIPMIDFLTPTLKSIIEILPQIIQYPISERLYIYDSSSSFHAYSTYIVDDRTWIKFMGLLLLLNLPYKEAITDSRWIGHRLNAGYGTLRLSCNTKKHLHSPKLCFYFPTEAKPIEKKRSLTNCIQTESFFSL